MPKAKKILPGGYKNPPPPVGGTGLFVIKDMAKGHVHSQPLNLAEAKALLAQLQEAHEKEANGRAFPLEILEC